MARPTKYNEEILRKTVAYIASCEDDLKNRIVNLPSIEGLAYEIGISRSTIYEWQKENKEFSDILEDLLAKQARALLNNGLSGSYNSTIAKVILTKHGFREGIDTTTDKPTVETSPEAKAKAEAFDAWYKKSLEPVSTDLPSAGAPVEAHDEQTKPEGD